MHKHPSEGSTADQRIVELEAEVVRLKAQLFNQAPFNEECLTEFTEGFPTYKSDGDFFDSLVKYIAAKTQMNYVFIGKISDREPTQKIMQTIALNAFGKLIDNIDYVIPDGWCGEMLNGRLHVYPKYANTRFPIDETLKEFTVEGYIGYTLYDAKGIAVGLLGVMHETEIHDVTFITSIIKVAGKRAELELERKGYKDIIDQKIQLLDDANNNLEQSNKNLEQFAYMASHDLQEPLRKIITFSNLIREKQVGIVDQGTKNYLERINTAAERMRQLVTDLLDYSRLQKPCNAFEPTNLNTIYNGVLSDLEFGINEKSAIIKYSPLPVIEAIPMQMNQLFTNLLSNFLKFSCVDRQPQLEITFRELTNNEVISHPTLNPALSYLELCFKDNGIGFDQKFAEKVFVIFQRLNGRSEYPGTGIGLAICKKITTFHQGEIYAEAMENEGAVFHVLLPVRQQPAASPISISGSSTGY